MGEQPGKKRSGGFGTLRKMGMVFCAAVEEIERIYYVCDLVVEMSGEGEDFVARGFEE